MKKILVSLSLLIASSALAETTTYNVEGMHCGSCAKSISAQVCKMDGIEKCDVTVGKVVITPKAGTTITKEQVQTAMSKAGEYKITGSTSSK
ncbi:zinc/cadmium/mercury/lead-transporting ATPase [compost metagenome]